MKLATTIPGLAMALDAVRRQGHIIGFVPTMGNLHEGHAALVKAAAAACDLVVVSIFVNPTQFGPSEDFDAYPRTLEADVALLREVGCDIVFTPTVEHMYGQRPNLTTVAVEGITDQLCGLSRPGHFDGVSTVVTKLFNLVQPHKAFFGCKDYQQLQVIRALASDLCFDLEVCAVETVRASDGLALSSRNSYLNASERQLAPKLYEQLQHIVQAVTAGSRDISQLAKQAKKTLTKHGFEVDYLEIRDVQLGPVATESTQWVVLVAAKLGHTRLIDNIVIHLE